MAEKTVMVIGSGGREHALVWKLAASPMVEKIYAVPGNPGIAAWAECISLPIDQPEVLLQFVKTNQVDLTIVGPEVPLTAGVVDLFQSEGQKIFGPTQAAARLESSKAFAKDFFRKYNIPTAAYEIFTEATAAKKYAEQFIADGKPAVIKADGLAAGKGVVIALTVEEADQAIEQMMLEKQFGDAGDKIVIEEFLDGEELSFFAISDGQTVLPFMAAQDHKRVFDGDQGPNTGGMGAYVNPPVYSETLKDHIMQEVIIPTLDGMKAEGCAYQGVLYAGLMLTQAGPKLLEYNVRFGDPETQVLMPMLDSDAYELFIRAASQELEGYELKVNSASCVAVILASDGYPGEYVNGQQITGLDTLQADTLIFHAGTKQGENELVTAGGRVMAVVRRADTMQEALQEVYSEVDRIHFAGKHYRKDIGYRALGK